MVVVPNGDCLTRIAASFKIEIFTRRTFIYELFEKTNIPNILKELITKDRTCFFYAKI